MKQFKNKKVQKSTWNKFSKVFIRIPGTDKKHLGHAGTLANVKNNCIKLSGFGVDITRVFLHRKITRNISCREKFFITKISAQVFKTNLTYVVSYLLLSG